MSLSAEPAPSMHSGQALSPPKGPARTPSALSARELAALRRAQMEAEELALRARLAQVALQKLLLALEEAHGLSLTEAAVDLRTGQIRLAHDAAARPDSVGALAERCAHGAHTDTPSPSDAEALHPGEG